MEWNEENRPPSFSDRRARLLTIDEKNIKNNFWRYVERQVGECSLRRFLWRGIILSLFSGLPTPIGCVLRGIIYRLLLGKVGSICFIEKNVQFNAPHRIFLGKHVSIGAGSLLDAGDGEIRLGDDVRIPRNCVLRAGPQNILIGNTVNFGQFCWIDGTGGLEIGNYTQIGSHVVIMTTNHDFSDVSIPIAFQIPKRGKIQIEEDVWIGTHAVVLPGVTIGRGTVIGAGAIVTKDIPEYSVALGVPAKVVKKRGDL